MPELPEVETVRRGLEGVLAGRTLERVEARRQALRFPLPQDFVQSLTGARVDALSRRGKYMLMRLDRDLTLIVHLGMTGRFEIEGAGANGAFALAAPTGAKHAHIVFETDAGARLTYFDARRFGFMDLAATDEIESHPRLAGLGPEPLSDAFGGAWLAEAFAGRRQPVKSLLLDQRVIAGLGNIYVSEALHRAGVSPRRAGGAIGRPRLTRLAAAIKQVLNEAIAAGGSTLRDFAAVDGELGYFQHRFEAYDRAGEACATADCPGTIRRIVQSGRSTFYCPTCQR